MTGRTGPRRRKSAHFEGSIVKWIFFGCATLSILTTVAILVTLIYQASSFFFEVSLWEFLTGTRWTPILKPRAYGVLPLVSGTLLVTLIAAAVALPIGLMTAIFLSEYAPDKIRRIIKPILKFLRVFLLWYTAILLSLLSPHFCKVFLITSSFSMLSVRG